MTTPSFWSDAFPISTVDTEADLEASGGALAGGGFVATWITYDTNFVTSHARAQVFRADGSEVGGEVVLDNGGYQVLEPRVTPLSDGGFLISWTNYNASAGLVFDMRAQRFDAEGNALGDDFQVGDSPDYSKLDAIIELADGRLLVTWTGEFPTKLDDDGGVYGQFMDADGNTLGDVFLINTETKDVQQGSAVAALADGGFIATFEGSSSLGDTSGIVAQVFDSSGAKVGAPWLVNTTTDSTQDNAAVTALAGGGFAVVWQDNSKTGGDKDFEAIRAQVYDALYKPVGGEILVNTETTGVQEAPAITALADGGFLISWTDGSGALPDSEPGAIRAQRFDADGTPNGKEFVVNAVYEGGQDNPTLITLADGRVFAAWSDNMLQGDTSVLSINGRFIEPREGPVDLSGTDLKDDLIGTVFDDTIRGGDNDDMLAGDDGDDTLLGNRGADILNGGDGNDVQKGGRGKDTLNGNDGDDVIIGGKQRDILIGEEGADTFRFDNLKASKVNAKKRDSIRDFDDGEGDMIDVSGIDAKRGGADNAFTFIGKDGFHDKKGELRYVKKGSDKVIVKGDVDGDGKADFSIKVIGVGKLADDDFVL